jgi:hypothetical protein
VDSNVRSHRSSGNGGCGILALLALGILLALTIFVMRAK